MESFFEKVYSIVKCVPRGRVVTYGTVAKLAGNARMSRQVGWALHSNPYFGVVPCHRVVNKQGHLASGFAFGGMDVQRRMLIDEGVDVSEDGRIDIVKYQIDFVELQFLIR